MNKKRKKQKDYVDPYELKGEETTAYLKEIAGLTALLGAGTVGATFMPTGRVAAASSVDPRSRIVGSVAESNQHLEQNNASKSDQSNGSISLSNKLSQSTSRLHLSESRSISLSQSESLSKSLSISQSVLSSLSLSGSQSYSLSESQSTSKLHHEKKTSTVSSVSQSTLTTTAENGTSNEQSEAQTLTGNSNLQQSLSGSSESLSTQIHSLELALGTLPLTTQLLNTNKLVVKSVNEEVKKPTFTGTVWTDLNGQTYPNADNTTPSFKFRLSTSGDSTVQNPKFILMIPGGFQASTNDITLTPENGEQVSTQYLGDYGPNGEQLYLISVEGPNPTWNPGIIGEVKLSLNPQNAGSYKYGWEWWKVDPPLISELADDANAAAWGSGAGSYAFNVNGQDINVVTSSVPFNDQQANNITYSVQAGSKQLDTSAYTISNVGATPYQGANTTDSGYEKLTFTFTPTQTLQNGDYFDVQLGLPGSD